MAVEAVKRRGLQGVGFVFTQDDSFTGVDLDDCIEDGEIAPWALQIVDSLDSYAEISPSKTGIKIIAKGSLPTDTTGRRRGSVEMYHSGRYFTITGEALESGKGITESQAALDTLYGGIVADRDAKAAQKHTGTKAATQTPQDARTTTAAGFSGDDKRLLEKASRKQLFRALFHGGNISGFKSPSDADVALCGMLAFWTGKDAERMDRLFRASALYREKWERRDYRESTIEAAISRCRDVYTGQTPTEGRESVVARFQAERDAVDSLAFDWRGGDTDFKVSHSLIDTGCVSGSLSATGAAAGSAGDEPTVAMAVREFLLAAGIGSKDTVRESVARLIGVGYLEIAVSGEKPTSTATTYRLRFAKTLAVRESKVVHSDTPPHCVYYGPIVTPVLQQSNAPDVTRMRAQYNPPRKAFDKNGRPTPNYTGHLEKKLPILDGRVYRHITQNPGVGVEEIAAHLGKNTKDGRGNLKKRSLKQLSSFGLVDERDGGYYPAESHADRFAEYLENSGCNAAESRQRDKIERERLAYEMYATGQKIVQDFHDEEQPGFDSEQQGFDSGEWVPGIEESMPTMPVKEATESPRTDAAVSPRGVVPFAAAEVVHALDCPCMGCSVTTPKFAVPNPYPTDSGLPRIEPRPPIPQDNPNQHDTRKAA
jgi:hypothetical protein